MVWKESASSYAYGSILLHIVPIIGFRNIDMLIFSGLKGFTCYRPGGRFAIFYTYFSIHDFGIYDRKYGIINETTSLLGAPAGEVLSEQNPRNPL